MECRRCNAQNLEGKRFCGDCGAPLLGSGPPIGPLEPAAGDLRDQIRAVIRKETKDRKIIEIETAQAIVTRVSEWGKLFAFFVGAPLLILAAVLALLGITSYKDVEDRLGNSKNQVARMQDAANAAFKQVDTLKSEIEERRAQLAKVDQILENVEALGKRVNILERRAKLGTDIDVLEATKAKALVAKIGTEFTEIKSFIDAQYPSGTRAADADGSKAKTVLKRAVVLTVRGPEDADKWQSAIGDL